MSRFSAKDMAALDSVWNRRTSIENPSVPLSSATIEDLWGDGGALTPAGRRVSAESVMTQAATFSCIRVLAETIASLPLQVFKSTDGRKEVARDHPLYARLHDAPNRQLTSFQWRSTYIAQSLIFGDAYALIEGSQLLLIPPNLCSAKFDAKLGLVYVVRTSLGEEVFGSDEILHLPGISLDGYHSISIALTAARDVIGEAMAVQEHSSRFFSNGARVGGVLSTDQVLKPESISRLRAQWKATQGGLANAYQTAVLEQGMKYQAVGMQSDHAQLIETRRLVTEQVAGAFRVPPLFIGDYSRMTYSNAEHNDLHFAKHTIAPWLAKIEQEFNRKLFASSEYFCEFNLAGLLRGDFKTQMDGFARGIQSAIYTPNEVRALLNLPPKEGGDKLYIQQNMSAADALPSPTDKPLPTEQNAAGQDVVFRFNMPAHVINIPAPVVNIEPTEVRIDVPQGPSPIVNVQSPVVNVEPPNVRVAVAAPSVVNDIKIPDKLEITKMPRRRRTSKMTRGPDGQLTETEQTETDI